MLRTSRSGFLTLMLPLSYNKKTYLQRGTRPMLRYLTWTHILKKSGGQQHLQADDHRARNRKTQCEIGHQKCTACKGSALILSTSTDISGSWATNPHGGKYCGELDTTTSTQSRILPLIHSAFCSCMSSSTTTISKSYIPRNDVISIPINIILERAAPS